MLWLNVLGNIKRLPHEVSESYARMYPRISYHDEMVYITEQDEEEPARVLTTIFEAEGNRFMELVVYTPTIEKADLQRAILGWIVFLYVLLLLAVILLNVWVFRRNMHPLYRLLAWLDAYRLGGSNAPLENNTRIYEFRKLNEAVTLSAERSEKLYEQQKLFIGNASHEMQTPLAICRNRLEMLMEEGNLSEKQLGELIKTHETLERLTRLNRSLLLLCKIENRQFSDVKDICYNHLLEQYLEDYKEVDVHHRHVSHIYGLHPGNLISPESTPELAEACRMTLNRRGDEGTGWSRAWKINFWARLGDGNRAWKLFKSLLHPAVDAATGGHGSGTFPNLFCSHPPFQIDGNYGGAAGVGEMLLQSHEGFIHLLPALPDSWTAGNFRGMRVRGGASIDLDWKDGRATRAVVTALVPGKFTVKMPASAVRAEVTVGGHTYTYKKPAFSLDLNKGEEATVCFF